MRELDFVAFSKKQRPILHIDIDRWSETPTDAAESRKRVSEDGRLMNMPFFMIAGSSLFLWRHRTPLEDPPDFSAPMEPLFERYRREPVFDFGVSIEQYQRDRSRYAFEMVIDLWLLELVYGVREPDPTFAPDKILVDAGVYEELRFGEVRSGVEVYA